MNHGRESEGAHTWRWQVHGALVVTKKDILLYYLKPPVLIFGVLFPLFFYLAFTMGRPAPAQTLVPGMIAMALWFTATAIGPLVTPWERAAKTYERLITTPVSLPALLAGDVLSGLIFGVCLSLVPIALGLGFTPVFIAQPLHLAAGVGLGALTFAVLGVLLAAPPTSGPSNIMLLSNLVRLPLLFVSGIFLPISRMPVWARWLAPISPLSYTADLMRSGFGESTYFPLWLCLAMLLIFTVVFFWGACRFHQQGRHKGL
jgi:ABC-2 type transport system permease protein